MQRSSVSDVWEDVADLERQKKDREKYEATIRRLRFQKEWNKMRPKQKWVRRECQCCMSPGGKERIGEPPSGDKHDIGIHYIDEEAEEIHAVGPGYKRTG